MSLQSQVILVAVLFLVFAAMSFFAKAQRLSLNRRLRKKRRRQRLSELTNPDAETEVPQPTNAEPDFEPEASPQLADDDDSDEDLPKGNDQSLYFTLFLIGLSITLGAAAAVFFGKPL